MTGSASHACVVSHSRPGLLDGRLFFINRDCDESRRAAMASEFAKAGLTGERISGVNGLAVPDDLRPYFFTGDKLHCGLRPGEVGCYASHIKAMQMLAERNLSFAVIFEDDAILPPNFEAAVADILAALPDDWDLAMLYGTSTRAVKKVAHLGDQLGSLVRYSRVPSGAVAYLISQRGAQKFLAPRKVEWPIDTDFRRPWAFNLEIFGILPQLVSHSGELPSAIQELGGRARQRRGIPLPKPGNWTGNPLHSPSAVSYNIAKLGLRTWVRCLVQNTLSRLRRMAPAVPALGSGSALGTAKSAPPAKDAIAP